MQDSEEDLMSFPLQNFTSDADLVIFDDRLFLRRMDDVDREALRLPYMSGESSFAAFVAGNTTKAWTHCVSVRSECKLVPAVERMNAVVTALHILQPGQVSLPLNYSMQRTVKHVTAGGLIRMLSVEVFGREASVSPVALPGGHVRVVDLLP